MLFPPSTGFLLLFFIKWFYLLCLVWMEPGAVLSFGLDLSQWSKSPLSFPTAISFFFLLPWFDFYPFLLCSVFETQHAFLMASVLLEGCFLLSFLPTTLPSLPPSFSLSLKNKSHFEVHREGRWGLLIAKADVAPPKNFLAFFSTNMQLLAGGAWFLLPPYLTL